MVSSEFESSELIKHTLVFDLSIKNLGHTKLIACFSDPVGLFLWNSAKKYKLVGVVLI